MLVYQFSKPQLEQLLMLLPSSLPAIALINPTNTPPRRLINMNSASYQMSLRTLALLKNQKRGKKLKEKKERGVYSYYEKAILRTCMQNIDVKLKKTR